MREGDTIAAIATPPGDGGVGIVRLSGPESTSILATLSGREPASFAPRVLVHVTLRDADGARIDDVLAVRMPGPRSYTGEDVVELHGHGGARNMGRLLRVVLAAGARAAAPGEFTRRAFASGRLDLTQAEAVAGIIGAASERALVVAQAQLAGALGARVTGLRDHVVAILAELEASLDFPDESLEPASSTALTGGGLATVAAALRALAGTAVIGRALTQGIAVALVGAPNVGKSSLLNAFLGEDRVLVSPEPGTTRDWVEARVVWDGIPVTLVDTAGDHATTSPLEARGVAMGRARAAHAELIVRVVEPSSGPGIPRPGELLVCNKADLGAAPAGMLAVSALTGEGLAELRAAVLRTTLGGGEVRREDTLVTSERQAAALTAAADALMRALALQGEAAPLEVVCEELRQAAHHLAELHGVAVTEAVLDALFSRFCIGK